MGLIWEEGSRIEGAESFWGQGLEMFWESGEEMFWELGEVIFWGLGMFMVVPSVPSIRCVRSAKFKCWNSIYQIC